MVRCRGILRSVVISCHRVRFPAPRVGGCGEGQVMSHTFSSSTMIVPVRVGRVPAFVVIIAPGLQNEVDVVTVLTRDWLTVPINVRVRVVRYLRIQWVRPE